MATPVKRRPPGSLEKALEGTHRTLITTRDKCLSPAFGHVTSMNAAILTVPSNINTDPKSESVLQSSATSRSGLLSRSRKAQALSTQASASRPLGLPTSSIDSGPSSVVHRRAAVLSQRHASPVSPFSYKKHRLLNSKGHPADLQYTQSPHEIPDQASMTFTPPPDHTLMRAYKKSSAVETTRTHRIVENQGASLNGTDWGAHMYSIFLFRARLIVFRSCCTAYSIPNSVNPSRHGFSSQV